MRMLVYMRYTVINNALTLFSFISLFGYAYQYEII